MKKNIFITLLIGLLFSSIANAGPYTSFFEEKFATALLSGKEDTLSLGFADYKLGKLGNLGSTEKSVARRNSLFVLSAPYSYKFHDKDHDDRLHFVFSYVEQKQNLQSNSVVKTYGSDKFYNFYSGYSRGWRLSDRWKFVAEGGGIAMHYVNKYNIPLADAKASSLDGIYYNVSADVVLLKPKVAFIYTDVYDWGKWTFKNNYEYFYGWTLKGSDSLRDATPSALQIANTLKFHFTLHTARFYATSIFVKMQRVDIYGDVVNSFATKSYYEFGTGVLLDTKKMTSLIDNIGIGLNVNMGSSLTGGSIVFYFNEI